VPVLPVVPLYLVGESVGLWGFRQTLNQRRPRTSRSRATGGAF
jgi:hypothetical protein